MSDLMRKRGIAITFCLCSLCMGSLFVCASQVTADEPPTWTTADGKFSVQAALIGIGDKAVKLKRVDNGKEITVPIEMLSESNQAFVEIRREADKLKSMPADIAEEAPPVASDEMSASEEPASSQETNAPSSTLEPGQIGVEQASATQIRLAPYGVVDQPISGMEWSVAALEPTVFAGQLTDKGIAMVVSVVPRAPQQGQRVAFLKATFNSLIQQIKGAGVENIKSAKPKLDGEIGERSDFGFMGDLPGGAGSKQFRIHVHFHPKHTYMFQATASEQADVDAIMAAATTFQYADNEPLAEIPNEVVQGVTAHINEILASIESGESEKVLQLLMPPDVYTQMKGNDTKWQSVVETFQQDKVGPLKEMLARLSWDQADYRADENTVSFPGVRRPIAFKLVDGNWMMQN